MRFNPIFPIRLGETGYNTFYVKDSNRVWHPLNHYDYFTVKKVMNQISEFEVKIYDIQDAEKAYLKEQAEVLFLIDKVLLLKGKVQKVEYGTAYECIVQGYGVEVSLLNREYTNSTRNSTEPNRVQYSSVSAQTIGKELLSTNSDGVSPWIISPDTDQGLFSSDYGDISMRFENANRLKALATLSDSIDYEWEVITDPDDYGRYDIDEFKIDSLIPNSTRATTSQYTFNITGASANCTKTSQDKDMNSTVNSVSCLGYGDGINQIKTSTYAASATYSTLSSDITAASSTISLTDATDFASSGTIRIMEEQITYTGKTGNNLTGCTRGANSTTARIHKKSCYVEPYYTTSSPESGSPIYTNGVLDHTIVDRSLIDLPTAEVVASKYLLDRKDPIERIKVITDEPQTIAKNLKVGDLVTINDSEAGFVDDDYRIVSIEYTSDYGMLSCELELSNRSLAFIEQMQKQRDQEESLQKYMQGSTNIYAISEADNADTGFSLNMRFYMPNEAININHVKTNFKLKNFRAYTSTAGVNSASSVVANSSDSAASYNLDSNAWTNVVDVTTANSDCEGCFLNGSIEIFDYSTADANSNGQFKARFYDGTNYYPDSDGMMICGGYISFDEPQSLTGAVSYYVPGNQKNKTFQLQVKWTGYSNDIDWDLNAGIEYVTMSRHTHDMTYDIYEETLTDPSVILSVGEDGGSMTTIGTYTSDQTDIDITDEVAAVGAGKWININFSPNKPMRIESNAYIQIFIDSE